MRRTRAFTLLEILVVISIIGILAGLSVSGFVEARHRAGGTTCLSNLHQLGSAIELYCSDWDGRVPFALDPATRSLASNTQWFHPQYQRRARRMGDLRDALFPYTRTNAVFRCPSEVAFVYQRTPPSTNWEKYGSSYYWTRYPALLGWTDSTWEHPAEQEWMQDSVGWHSPAGTLDLVNELYADNHVKVTHFVAAMYSDWIPDDGKN